ncbi:MAG TPA: hypothetical protein VL551_17760 [Actinospica sp.]|nr:hypothetical protein [Actinospica sp.]
MPFVSTNGVRLADRRAGLFTDTQSIISSLMEALGPDPGDTGSTHARRRRR